MTDTRARIWIILTVLWGLLDIGVHVLVNMVEPLRIAGNIVLIAAALSFFLNYPKTLKLAVAVVASAVIVGLNAYFALSYGSPVPMLIFITVGNFLLMVAGLLIGAAWMSGVLRIAASLVLALIGGGAVVIASIAGASTMLPRLLDGRLEDADYWSTEPMILSAGMGFDNIIGVSDLSKEGVRAAGGAWFEPTSCLTGTESLTSAVPAAAIPRMGQGFADFDDGLPIVFSWPVATDTVDVGQYRFTLNNGDVVYPNSVTMVPNWELNERNVVVAFGDFGNRLPSSDPGALFPVRLDIEATSQALLLVGPDGQEVEATGLSWTTDQSPYDVGPKLVGAKLNLASRDAGGEGGVRLLERGDLFPNSEFDLYDAPQYRLRLLTSGGFSPDGVTALRPDMFEQFFRLHGDGPNWRNVVMDKVGQDYNLAGGTIRILGLSDLGQAENEAEGIAFDDCYAEDRDNYIDIILTGDLLAARSLTFVEIPSLEGGYRAFYNPGGPGPQPFEGVTYSAPGPADMEPIIMALDDPMRVSRL